ncbi:MAG: ParB/RepB/Spo0J family partition protein [Isosphaeraceae bacterium]
MDILDLPLDDLVLDPTLNLRDQLNNEAVERYRDSWDWMPPVTVFEVDGRWLLADGFHRHAAAVIANRKTIQADVKVGTFDEAMDFVAGANLRHGLPLTRAERRRAVEVKLRLCHDQSDRSLAETLSVSRDLIAKVRRQLTEAGQIPIGNTRVGADGKVYPAALGRDPNEHLPRDRASSARDDPRDRGGREHDPAPWDDTTDPLAPVRQADPGETTAPWEAADAKAVALAPPSAVAAPSIDEMLSVMTRQITEVVQWTHADGFDDAYRTAGGNVRGLFQSAVIKLATRADQLRKS